MEISVKDQRWQELTIQGKNIQGRTNHTTVIYSNQLYLYGGYDVMIGIFKDFYSLDLSPNTKFYNWKCISNQSKPGPLRSHTAVVNNNCMYMYGGQSSSIFSSNMLHIYNFQTQQFTSQQSKIVALQSHTSFSYGQCVYFFGGYIQTQGRNNNDVYFYKIGNKQWGKLQTKGQKIQGRCTSSAITQNGIVYVFGGKTQKGVDDQLWSFNIKTLQWTHVITKNSPKPRRGHSLVVIKQKLYLFGGIQDVTKQLNDIHMFDGKWHILQNLSNQVYQMSPTLKREDVSNESLVKSQRSKRAKQLKFRSQSPTRRKQNSLKLINNSKILDNSSSGPVTLDQKVHGRSNALSLIKQSKLQKFFLRKSMMLKEIEVQYFNKPTKQQKQQIYRQRQKRKLSPTSQLMKQSVKMIGQQDKKKIENKGISVQYDKEHLRIIGKKPCARDGHSCEVFDEKMVIFGGDRHNMSFNDVYFFDVIKAQKSLQLYSIKQKQQQS